MVRDVILFSNMRESLYILISVINQTCFLLDYVCVCVAHLVNFCLFIGFASPRPDNEL